MAPSMNRHAGRGRGSWGGQGTGYRRAVRGAGRHGGIGRIGVASVLVLLGAVIMVASAIPAAAGALGVGVTVAGGNGYGSASNQLSFPYGVAVDAAGNVYVSDINNGRVQRWAPGATSGVTVAGGNGIGPAENQLDVPTAVALDASGNLYVADLLNWRVQRWAPGASSGVTVAGGHGQGSAANQVGPNGVAVDSSGNVYVGDTGYDRVQRWAPGAASGVTVAGGNGRGSAANQLHLPYGVAVDPNGNVFVADSGNARVQRWAPGATSGVTVAGGNGDGSAPGQLTGPYDVDLDRAGNVYVADPNNARVQRWAPGATSGVTVAGGNGFGTAANQLGGAYIVAVDAAANIYVGDSDNSRVQRWPAVAPAVIPGNGVVTAPSSGTVPLDVSVTLDAASLTTVTVPWTTLHVPGAPTSPILGPQAPTSDYTASSGVVTFTPGQTTAHVTIPVNANSTGADYEYVVVSFNHAIGANIGGFWGLGFGVIESAAHAVLPTVLPGAGTVAAPSSGTADLNVPVTLSHASTTAVTVQWNTLYVPGAANTSNGPQAPTSDYTASSGVVTFTPGQTTGQVTIPVNANSDQSSEYILVSFHNPTGANIGGIWGLGTGIITNPRIIAP